MTQRRPLVLLVGSGHPTYREYLVREAARYVDLWLIEEPAPTWQTPYLAGYSSVNTFDPAESVRAVRQLAGEHRFDGVYCYHEAMILAAAAITQELGLPGPDPAAIAACRDKARTRQALAAARVAQPGFAVLAGEQVPGELVERLGLPLVVKPRTLGASQGVIRIDSPDQLANGLQVSRNARQQGMVNSSEVLIEEYVAGEEISVDGYFDGSEYTPLFLARKRLGPEPYFEEMGHTVDAGDPLLTDRALLAALTAAHRALDVRQAITHTEMRLTAAGPMLIEVNGRLGGDLIPLLATRAADLEPARYGVELAVGERPAPPTGGGRCSGIRFLQPEKPCVVDSITVDAARAAELGVLFEPIVPPGTQLLPPPDGYASRYALLIADGADAAECNRRLDAATELVRLESHAVA